MAVFFVFHRKSRRMAALDLYQIERTWSHLIPEEGGHYVINDDVIMILQNRATVGDEIYSIPHRDCLDLALTYFILHEGGASGRYRELELLDEETAEERGLGDADTLFRIAAENTARKFPVDIQKPADSMYVLTNTEGVFGATALMYSDGLEQISQMTGGDIYIIPSSIHEVICVPQDAADPEDLKAFLIKANREILEESQLLSNYIYYYDSAKHKVNPLMTESQRCGNI